ncbi:MAG: formylglycine-generating enzyme family protein, partial [Planctomycetota bacterium]
ILRRFPGNRDAVRRLDEIEAVLKKRKDRFLWIAMIGVAGTLLIAVGILGAILLKSPSKTTPKPPPVARPPTKKPPRPSPDEGTPPPEEKVEIPAVDEKEMEARLQKALERKAKGDWQGGLKELRGLQEVEFLAERVKKEIEALESERVAGAETLEKAGELEAAVAAYKEMETHFPESGYGDKARGLEYAHLLAEGEKALEIGETDRGMELLGRAASLGVDDRASRLLEKTNLSSWRETAERFERTGYWVGAEFYYKKILEVLKDDEAIKAKVTRIRKRIRYDETFKRMDEHFAKGDYDAVLKETKIALATGVDDGTVERVQAMIESIRGMIFIPAGPFNLGDEEGSDREKPVHSVDLPSFCIMKNEVTVAEYSKFLLTPAGEGHFPADLLEQKKHPDRPVVGLTLANAQAYAKSRGLTLPTEALWERAARGKERKAWPWGDEFWENMANTKEAMKGGPVEVTEYKFDRSPDGVRNMSGNVAEWTVTPFAPYPGGAGEYPEGQVVIRGGDFTSDQQAARGASRRGASPEAGEKHIGFRCVLVFDFKSLKDLK